MTIDELYDLSDCVNQLLRQKSNLESSIETLSRKLRQVNVALEKVSGLDGKRRKDYLRSLGWRRYYSQ